MGNTKFLKAFLQSMGFSKVEIKDQGDAGLSVELEGEGDVKALEGIAQLNAVVQNAGGAKSFAETFEALKGLPATLAQMRTQMNEQAALVKNVSTFAESVATKADATKKALIAGLVQNKSNPFDEATLNSMALEVLEKLDVSYQPVDYAGLGAGLFTNSTSDDDKPLALPDMFGLMDQSAAGKTKEA